MCESMTINGNVRPNENLMVAKGWPLGKYQYICLRRFAALQEYIYYQKLKIQSYIAIIYIFICTSINCIIYMFYMRG